MAAEELVILMAEDDDGHAYLVEQNLRDAGVSNRIVRAPDGQAALDFIHSRGAFAGRVPGGPLLVLLDINMPLADGVEVLRQLKRDPATAQLPVIMLTTTDDPPRCNAVTSWGAAATSPSRSNTIASSKRSAGWVCTWPL
jgi:CheY-like chemotaxis protein